MHPVFVILVRMIQRQMTAETEILTSATESNFNLESAYRAMNSGRSMPSATAGSEHQLVNAVRTARGYYAESLLVVETISPQLRK